MTSDFQILSRLDFLEKKISLLVVETETSRRRIRELEAELAEQQMKLASQEETIQQQQQQLRQAQKKTLTAPESFTKSTNFVKIVSDNRTNTETIAELKQKLTGYIDELDRCIAYLSHLT